MSLDHARTVTTGAVTRESSGRGRDISEDTASAFCRAMRLGTGSPMISDR